MIGSNFLSSSPPGFDSLLSKEFPSLDTSFLFDIGSEISSLESGIECGQSSCSVSPVHSSSSYDDYDLSAFEDINSILPITDSLASKLLDENLIDELDLSDLDWVSIEDTINEQRDEDDRVSSTSNSSEKKKKKSSKLPEYLKHSKSWSRMSFEERLTTAHALTKIISHQMGLREQIEVIKLIDPSTVLSPNATEYSINLSQLNNAKLKRIKEFVKKHAVSLANADDNSLVAKNMSSSSSNCSPGKRRQKRLKHPYLKELKMRQKKVEKQDEKEKRSGLFMREKIIKKLNNPHEEDEEVDILDV